MLSFSTEISSYVAESKIFASHGSMSGISSFCFCFGALTLGATSIRFGFMSTSAFALAS
uniref:Uncharacterized protein n=1 Tax=Arundo donax TaxID=35708 RepID=A0A0A8XPA1_ARUDO